MVPKERGLNQSGAAKPRQSMPNGKDGSTVEFIICGV